VLEQATGNPGLTWLTTARTRGEATTFPHIIFSALLPRTHTQMALCPGTPKVESRNCPDLDSRDSQSGVPKLSRFGLPGLYMFIISRSNLRLGWSLKRTCRSPWELSNGVSHSTCTHRDWVDSWLLVVGSQIVSLTPDPSFNHNVFLDVQMAHARPFRTFTLQDLSNSIKNTSMRGVLTPTITFWVFESLGELPSPIFRSVSGDLTLPSKWGCDKTNLAKLI
jgi:hypothetical protein